jgi:hypothetical protein
MEYAIARRAQESPEEDKAGIMCLRQQDAGFQCLSHDPGRLSAKGNVSPRLRLGQPTFVNRVQNNDLRHT